MPERNNADSMQRIEKPIREAAQHTREQSSDAHTVTIRQDSCTISEGSATIQPEDASLLQGVAVGDIGGDAEESAGKRDPRDFALWKAAKVWLDVCMHMCM